MSSNLISTLLDECQSEHPRSELCGLGLLQANQRLFHYVIGISGILPYKRNGTLQTFLSITQDFVHLHSIFTQLYNTAASPASCVCSAGSLAIRVLPLFLDFLAGIFCSLQLEARSYMLAR